jgi:hypothetical protein
MKGDEKIKALVSNEMIIKTLKKTIGIMYHFCMFGIFTPLHSQGVEKGENLLLFTSGLKSILKDDSNEVSHNVV